ncbi:DNA photolyase family protein [bacterium]|nr:DNA photolyase family protein [bacterium]
MQSSFDTVLFVFRRDLRLTDNRGLAEATRRSRRVIPVFIFDSNILDDIANRGDRRLSFIHDALAKLQNALRGRGSDLVVLHGDPMIRIPKLAADCDADAVFVNDDYEPYARVRDDAIAEALVQDGRAFHAFKDHVVYHRDEILTKSGDPYKVFTPYRRAWLERLEEEERLGHSPVAEEYIRDKSLATRASLKRHSDTWSLKDLGFTRSDTWLEAGEDAAQQRLEEFLPSLQWYAEDRDYPARKGTSGLSAHLRFGTISIRECVRHARESDEEGAQTWLHELIWREFYQMLLDRFPHVVNHSFKAEYNSIRWPGGDKEFTAWCEGRTGYPIVDAAMRHFNATGWMHNRLRMVVAMFLTKDLLVDWRRGEAYFAEGLLDYDLAANNGGWQWSASTGADGAPYFRIFNPVLQSKKYDPDGSYIREHLPELAGFTGGHIHWPHDADLFAQQEAGCVLGENYPHPIVDHAEQKDKAIALFKNL